MFQGSLARVEAVGKGKRWCVISGVKQKALNNCSERYRRLLLSCPRHNKRGCMSCLKAGNKKEAANRRGKLDRIPMDIRVRRTDELFLIHREPTEEEAKKKKWKMSDSANEREREKRKEAAQRRRQGRTPEDKLHQDQRWVVPPLERETKPKILGEYILPTGSAEVNQVREEFEKSLAQKGGNLDELLDRSDIEQWNADLRPRNDPALHYDLPTPPLKRADRTRKPPVRFQAGV